MAKQRLVCFVSYANFFCFFNVSGVCSVLFSCFSLFYFIVKVLFTISFRGLIAWKDSSLKRPVMCRVGR